MNRQPISSQIIHIPFLAQMRDFYRLPRIAEIRFPRYLAFVGTTPDTCNAPLIRMNPMAKEHLGDVLEPLLACDEDAPRWLETFTRNLGVTSGFLHGFAVVDDIAGGWTARIDIDMARRFTPPPANIAHWCVTTLFASESYTIAMVEQEVHASIIRRQWHTLYGPPQTLRDMLAQEQIVSHLTQQSPSQPNNVTQEQEELLMTILDETAYPLLVAALFGDAAAASLGYRSQGFAEHAGLAYAANPTTPWLMPIQQSRFFDATTGTNALRVVPE
jgi:hypothetical protein